MALSFAALFAACGTGKKNAQPIALDTALTAEEIAARRFTPEVMWKMGRLASSQISPDGTAVLYALTYYSVSENRSTTSLWVQPMPTDSLPDPQPRQITETGYKDTDPRWSADGRTIFFLSNRSGSQQEIWSIRPDGTAMRRVSIEKETAPQGDITAFGVAPQNNKIWFTREVKVQPVSGGDWYGFEKSNVRIYDDLMERHWDTWEDGSYSHIFVADFNVHRDSYTISNPVDIMPGEAWDAPMAPYFDAAEIAWNHAGTALAYTCKKMTGYEYAMSTDSDIYLYSLADGSTLNLTKVDGQSIAPAYDLPGYDRYPVFSPDDKLIAWRHMPRARNEADREHILVMSVTGESKTDLTPVFDYSAENLVWSADGRTIYFLACIEAETQICSVDRETGIVSVLTRGPHDYTAFSMAGGKTVAEKTTLSMATELFVVDLGKAALDTACEEQPLEICGNDERYFPVSRDSRLSHINDRIYEAVDMGVVEKRWITTSDNQQMLTWVALPPDFDPNKKYPTLLYCQGGPQSVISQRWSYRWNFQLMSAQGYIVVAPNRRGLPSFGTEWLDQISGDYSGQNIRDYLSAIDAVSSEPWVDRDHLGAIGASYGGYSVFYLAGRHDGRFKALIAHCGMFNLESFYGETEELWFPYHDLGGAPWEQADKPVAKRSYSNSPHLAVNRWTAPILIITGENDYRIPYTQSLEAFTAARAHGIPARLVSFADEAHQVFKPQNSLVWNREFFGWLDKYLK